MRILRHLAAASIFLMASNARADEVRVLSANNLRQFLTAAAPAFEAQSGHHLQISFGSTAKVREAASGSAMYDAVLVESETLDQLGKAGKLAAPSVRKLAKAEMVLMTKPGRHLVTNTVDQFRQALLDAKSIAYPNPSEGGLSGPMFARALTKAGLADRVKPKEILGKNTADVVRMVERDEAEIGASQRSETRTDTLTLIRLPKELGTEITLSGAVFSHAERPEAASSLLEYLSSPAAAQYVRLSRLEPAD